MEYEDIINEIVQQTDIKKDELEKLVEEKRSGMSGLLTPLGAAALIAKEKGIKVEKKEVSIYPKLSELTPGLVGVNLVGRIIRIFPTRDFTRKDGSPGKVCNVLLADSTAQIRTAFWNDQCTEFVPKLNVGDVIKLIDCSTKEGWQGQLEATISFRTKVILNPLVESDPRIEDLPPTSDIKSDFKSDRLNIADLKDQDKYKEVLVTLIKFYRCTLFASCPKCSKTVSDESDCPDCGKVSGVKKCVVECGIDDTTGYIRAVFFVQHAEKLLKKPTNEIWEGITELKNAGLDNREAGLTYLNEHCKDVLGREYILSGQVEDNEFSGLNLKVYSISDPNPIDETKRILNPVSV